MKIANEEKPWCSSSGFNEGLETRRAEKHDEDDEDV
jgi:hypothetical protein